MPPKGSSSRAVNQQATAAGLGNSPNAKRRAPMTRVASPQKPPRKKSNAEATTDAPPAVTVERAEEEGDQTPYHNPFQR
jgi:hypothetical protein